jgi:hypothetical protein
MSVLIYPVLPLVYPASPGISYHFGIPYQSWYIYCLGISLPMPRIYFLCSRDLGPVRPLGPLGPSGPLGLPGSMLRRRVSSYQGVTVVPLHGWSVTAAHRRRLRFTVRLLRKRVGAGRER